MTDFSGLFSVRDGKESDINFIMATFLRGLYYGDSWFSIIPKDIFMYNYKPVITAILSSPKTAIKVACLPDDEDVILGYSLLGDDYQTIHWVYVKNAWRRKGVAKALLPSRPTTITHLTELGKSLMIKFEAVTFNPFAIGL